MTAKAKYTVFGRVRPPRPDWLGLEVPEPAIEPNLPIVDTHHHLWVRPDNKYLTDTFIQDVDCGHHIESTIFCECHAFYRQHGPEHLKCVGETEFALQQHTTWQHTEIAAGIIAFADLTEGAKTEEALAAHLEASRGRLRGIRHRGSWDADPAIGGGGVGPKVYLDPHFIEGLRRLSRLGLVFDALAFFTQLDDVKYAADKVPDATVVLNHCGGPLGYGKYTGREAEIFQQWRLGMAELAERPNVHVKLGGLMIRLAAFDFDDEPSPPTSAILADLWHPYITACIELFGTNRCVVESNFPVEKMGVSYGTLWNTFKRITQNGSSDEKAAIYQGNAKRIYGLNPSAALLYTP